MSQHHCAWDCLQHSKKNALHTVLRAGRVTRWKGHGAVSQEARVPGRLCTNQLGNLDSHFPLVSFSYTEK